MSLSCLSQMYKTITSKGVTSKGVTSKGVTSKGVTPKGVTSKLSHQNCHIMKT